MATINKPYDMVLHHLMQIQGDAFIQKVYSPVLTLACGRGKPLNTKQMDFIPLLNSLWILRSVGMKIDTEFLNIKENITEINEVLDQLEVLCEKLESYSDEEGGDGGDGPLIMLNTQNAQA